MDPGIQKLNYPNELGFITLRDINVIGISRNQIFEVISLGFNLYLYSKILLIWKTSD